MRMTAEHAKKLGLVRDGDNWVASRAKTLIESRGHGGSNRGMAAAHPTPKRTHAQSLASIRESCLAIGMSAEEAAQFLKLGERRG